MTLFREIIQYLNKQKLTDKKNKINIWVHITLKIQQTVSHLPCPVVGAVKGGMLWGSLF